MKLRSLPLLFVLATAPEPCAPVVSPDGGATAPDLAGPMKRDGGEHCALQCYETPDGGGIPYPVCCAADGGVD